jgi:hypothetical protein
MEMLDETYNRLGAPSATQLRIAILRAGGQISAKEARDYVARQADRQLFADLPESEGQTATRDENSDMQADLIDLTQYKGNIKFILIAINPWNRKIAMEGIESKTPQRVTTAFHAILNRMKKPQVLSTDQDAAFAGVFNRMLDEKQIVHRYKRGMNSIAVLDRAIKTVKITLFKRMARENTTKFDKFIEETEAGYNEKVHEPLPGSPDDLEKNTKGAKVAHFQLMKDNAGKFEKNHALNERNTNTLKEAGQFRVAKKKETFDRAFKPNYENEIREVREIKAGDITDETGKTYPINNVMAVPEGTQNISAPDFRGRGLRDARLKEDLKEFARDLYDAMGNQELALTSAARMMTIEFTRTKPTHMSFGQFLKLYPNLFKVTGEGTRKKVRAIRTRLTRKQRVA